MHTIRFSASDRQRVDQFIKLPFEIYKNIPQWVPPLSIDVRTPFSASFPFYQHSEAAFFLALTDNGRPVGRLVVLENRNYNDFNQEKTAFFWMFECIDDVKTAQSLFEASIEWALSQGLTRIIGPKGFTALDGSGLLVKGFDHRPAFGLPYNPPYYPALVVSAGFEPLSDSVSGYLSTNIEIPEKIHRVADLVKKRRGLRVAQYRTRKDLRPLIPKLGQMYNDALGGTTGNVPLTVHEVETLANQMLWFADPKLIKIIMKDDEPVGFLFAYPDISAAIQRINGRVFPTGWIHLLREVKTTKWVNVNGAGIIEKYRGLGGTALLFNEMIKSVRQGNFVNADLVQIGVENDKMQRELRDLGVDFYKTHRMYQQDL
jgi:hypothetical protein